MTLITNVKKIPEGAHECMHASVHGIYCSDKNCSECKLTDVFDDLRREARIANATPVQCPWHDDAGLCRYAGYFYEYGLPFDEDDCYCNCPCGYGC